MKAGNDRLEAIMGRMFENLTTESKQNSEFLRKELEKVEEAITQKVATDQLDEHKKSLKEFIESVSGDISSFNRLLHFFEEKLVHNTKYIEHLKKKESEPKFSMRFKDDSNDRTELLHIIEKTVSYTHLTLPTICSV
eukprot:TRINITY_DN4003_c0_g1_i6.p4 TRINITY_DN4003_c0_g1~~TRINITY_DN4003_c0_g1_i6.p4  ORF type:complete len:137 (-),score=31.15 TRINITY_DN4003_c0_g1_i6:47-457(-)